MTTMADMDILKEIPGYKAIMKAVLKTQIQLLVEQLSDHTGEESIVLTASVNDGSLSHLGSSTGKGFLEGRDEIKSQFLGYCLKSHHKRKTQEEPAPPYQRSNISHPGPRTAIQQTAKRPRLHPVALSRAGSQGSDLQDNMPSDGGGDAMFTSTPVRGPTQSQRGSLSDSSVGPSKSLPSESPSNLKLEQSGAMLGDSVQPIDRGTDLMAPASLPSSIGLSHTQTSATDKDISDKEQSDTGDASQDGASIKVEPVTESELDLEITGVEMGDNSSQMSGENWGQNVSGFGPGAAGDGSFDQSGSQAGYIVQLTDGIHTGRPKAGRQNSSTVAVQDKSRDPNKGVGHMVNYDAQSFYTRKYLGNVMDWRAIGTLERPVTVEEHIKDAFVIRPPPGLPRTESEINAAQRQALGLRPMSIATIRSSVPKPQYGQPKIDTKMLVPQMGGKFTKQPAKGSTMFRKNLPKAGPKPEAHTAKDTKQAGASVLKTKRPRGRPRKELAENQTVGRSRKELAVKFVNLPIGHLRKEPPAQLTIGQPHKELPAKPPVLTALKRKVGRPRKQCPESAIATPTTVSPMKRKVGRPRKIVPDVFPVSLRKVDNVTDVQTKESEKSLEKSPLRKNYVEPIEDIIDIEEETITNNENIDNDKSADMLIEQTSDFGSKIMVKHVEDRQRIIPAKALVEPENRYVGKLPSGFSQRPLLKRPRGRPRKYPAGSTLQRPYFRKPLHDILKRPVGRPKKIKKGTSLEKAKGVGFDKEDKLGPKKVPVVLIDDIMKTRSDKLLDPKKEATEMSTDEKACIVNIYDQKLYIYKSQEEKHGDEDDQSDGRQLQYGEMEGEVRSSEGGRQLQIGQQDTFGNVEKSTSYTEVQRQVDKTEAVKQSQTGVPPKSRVHLPKAMWGEILEVADKEGVEAAALFYGISGSTIYKWRTKIKNSEDGEPGSSNDTSSIEEPVSLDKGVAKKIVDLKAELEKMIIDWIKEQRQGNNSVTAEMIKVYALAVTIGKVPEFEASDEWLRSFIDRNNLSDTLGI